MAHEQHLACVTATEIEMLDAWSREVERDLAAIEKDLGEITEMVRRAMSEIEEIRSGGSQPA